MPSHVGRYKKNIAICKRFPFTGLSDTREFIAREMADDITRVIEVVKQTGNVPRGILIHIEADYGEFTRKDNHVQD